MGVISSLIVALTVRTDDFDSSLRAVEKSLDRTAGKVSDLGNSLTIGLTAPIIGLAAGASAMAASFDESFDKMVGLTRTSADEVAGLKENVLQLAGSTAQAPKELADALFTIESAGIHGAAATETLKDAAMAATAGLGSVRDIAGVVSSAINAYGSANLSATQATSMLVASTREMKNGAQDLIPSISGLFPLASQLKIPISDLGAAMAVMTNNGLDAGKAAQALTRIMGLLEKPSADSEKVLAEAGMSFADLKEKAGEEGLGGVLKLLAQHFGTNDTALARLFPSLRSISAVFALIRGDGTTLDDVFGRLSNTTGKDLNEAFGAVARGPAFQFRQLASELQVVMIRLGDDILPVVIPFVERLAAEVERLAGWIAQLDPGMQDLVIVLAGAAAAIGPLLVGLGAAYASISTLIGGIRLLTVAFSPAIIAMLPFIAAAAALGLAALFIIGRWEELKAGLANIFSWLSEQVKAVFGPIMGPIKAWAADLANVVGYLKEQVGGIVPSLNAVGASAKGMALTFKDDVTAGFQKVLDSAKKMAEGIVGSAKQVSVGVQASTAVVDPALQQQISVVRQQISVWQQLRDKVVAVVAEIKSAVPAAFDAVTTRTIEDSKKIQAALQQMALTTASNMGNLAAQFLQGKESFSQMVEAMIQDLIRLVAEMLIYAAIASAIGGPFGGAFASGVVGGLFHRATGGPMAAGQTAIVGENGPELFTAPSDGMIVPNDKLKGIGGANNQIVQNFNFSGLDYGSQEAAKRLATALKDAAKQGTQESIQLGLQLQKLSDQYNGRAV